MKRTWHIVPLYCAARCCVVVFLSLLSPSLDTQFFRDLERAAAAQTGPDCCLGLQAGLFTIIYVPHQQSCQSPQYFQDALIDVVTGLGVPATKIILNTPAFGNSFNLMEPGVNLPGSATTGLPQSLTYQQVGRRGKYLETFKILGGLGGNVLFNQFFTGMFKLPGCLEKE